MKYRVSEEMTAKVMMYIQEHDEFKQLRSPGCRIICLWGDDVKKKNRSLVYADTEKIRDKLKAICEYDYIITFYEPLCMALPKDVLLTLIRHELMHIDFEEGAGGEDDYMQNTYRIRQHDVQVFRSIIEELDIDWISNRQLKMDMNDQL